MAVMDYRTRDGLAHYGFTIEYDQARGWRIYIVFQPFQPYAGDQGLPYLAIDNDGRHFVDWPSKIDNLSDARTVAGLWAEVVHRLRMIDPLPVSVYLQDGHQSTIRDVESALKAIGNQAGFDVIAEDAPIYGSFWQRFRAKVADPHTQEEIYERLLKLEYAAEVKLLAVPESQANLQNAQGLAALIEALKGETAAVIQLGPLIVVKAPRPEGESALLCRKLTAKELRMLEADPCLLKDPVSLMARLATPDEGHPIAQAQ